MTYVVAFIGSMGLLFSAGSSIPDANLSLESECMENTACIPMLLNLGSLGEGVLVSSKAVADGYTEFTVRVRGRLATAEPREHMVLIRGYTDGIVCCDFGQASVGVLGYSERSKPVLATSGGPLLLEDESLEVGCSGCVEVLDSSQGKAIATYPSPSWDLTLVGLRETDLFAGPTGELYVHVGSGCVELVRDSLFKKADNKRCSAMSGGSLSLSIKNGACT